MKYILRLPAIIASTGLSRSTIYALIKARKFPAQSRLGARAVGWDSALVERWIADKLNGEV